MNLVSRSILLFTSSNSSAHFHTVLESLPEHSYSFVLTLAAHINSHSPNLLPPNSPLLLTTPNPTSSYAPIFGPWCDFLSQCVNSQSCVTVDKMAYLMVEVTPEYVAKLPRTLFQIVERKEGIQSLIDKYEDGNLLPVSNYSPLRIGVANLSSSVLNNNPLEPRIHIDGLLKGIFHQSGDTWRIFHILRGEIPSESDLNEMDVLILSGSSLSVNSHVSEIEKFFKVLRKHIVGPSHLKIVGFCFGHQAISHLAGSLVETKLLIARPQTLEFDELKLQKFYFLKDLLKATIRLCEFHKDHVTKVPEGFSLLSWSSSCSVESVISHDNRILSFQAHPEYTIEYLQAYEKSLNEFWQKPMSENYTNKDYTGADHKVCVRQLREMLRKFMNSQVI